MPLKRVFISILIMAVSSITLRQATSASSSQRTQTPWIQPDEGLVLLWVSAVNPSGNSVPGLTRSNFHIWEDDREQKIEYFAPNNDPISVGIIRGGGENSDTAITFLKTTTWTEEYFEVRTEEHAGVRAVKVDPNFSTEFRHLSRMRIDCPEATVCRRNHIRMDQIFIALEYLREAANLRKVVLLFGESDDPDPISDPRWGRLPDEPEPIYVMNRALRQDAQIYTVETLPAFFDDISNEKTKNTKDPQYSSNYFEAISRGTGGRVLGAYANSAISMEKAAAQIARGLEMQYLIGYRSTNPARDGKWRSIRIAVVPDIGGPTLTVWTRSGYYADKQVLLKAPNPE